MANENEFTGADILLKALKDQEVDTIFGYPGGAVLPIYDAIFGQNFLKHVLVRQEAGAVHAAEGYARSSGKVGVLLVTSGPGVTNAMTGIANAHVARAPILVLSGTPPRPQENRGALQDMSHVEFVRPLTRYARTVREVCERPRETLQNSELIREGSSSTI